MPKFYDLVTKVVLRTNTLATIATKPSALEVVNKIIKAEEARHETTEQASRHSHSGQMFNHNHAHGH